MTTKAIEILSCAPTSAADFRSAKPPTAQSSQSIVLNFLPWGPSPGRVWIVGATLASGYKSTTRKIAPLLHPTRVRASVAGTRRPSSGEVIRRTFGVTSRTLTCVYQSSEYTERMKTISSQLRKAIETSGESRYSISQATGVSQATLSRFVTGKAELRSSTIDTLGSYLRLELRPKSRGQRKGI